MSKRHFEAIARVLCETKASEQTCLAMAYALATFNPLFDRERFLAACRGE